MGNPYSATGRCDVEVRLAKYDDITNMVVFMKGQHAKSVYKDVPFNPVLFRKSLKNIIKGGNGDVLLAVSRAGKIRGMLMAWHESMTWTHQKVATDIHLCAEQGGDMLLRAFRLWAQVNGCTEVCMGTFNEKDEERIEKLYNRLGLRTVGKTYRMQLNEYRATDTRSPA